MSVRIVDTNISLLAVFLVRSADVAILSEHWGQPRKIRHVLIAQVVAVGLTARNATEVAE